MSDDTQPMSEINPTPLVDVLLVLLIILIIALPLSSHRTSLDMPTKPGMAGPTVTIDIEFDGSLYWNGAPVVDLDTLERQFRSAVKSDGPSVLLNANRSVRYDTVAKVLAIAQRSGVQKLGFTGQEQFVD